MEHFASDSGLFLVELAKETVPDLGHQVVEAEEEVALKV